MTKKRKRYPDLNQKLERPWCYYCERDFDDLKILISHQKAKHFKCDRCGRRLNTAGGLSVHMNQVHKENLTHVENANPGRQGLDVEIFGMEGVPADIIEQHVQEVTQIHFAEEAERARITGNPIRGPHANGAAPPNKRPRVVETLEEIEKRAKQYRHDKQNGIVPAAPAPAVKEIVTDAVAPPIMPPQQSPFGAAPFAYPPHGPPPPGMPQTGALPPRPTGTAPPDAIQSSIDDLIAGVQKEVPEKKSKKEKNMRLIYNDENISPEEKMAALPRFAEFMRT